MPEFTRTSMTIRRKLADGSTIGLLGFVNAHEQGKMTDELKDEIVQILNRGTHFEALVSFIRDDLSDFRDLLDLAGPEPEDGHWLENQRQALLAKVEKLADV